MGDYALSEGTLKIIMKGGDVTDPIMQVLGCKRIASGSSDKERFRILLSDGRNVISFAMLTTQINDTVSAGELAPNTVIKIKRFITSVINNAGKGNKRVLVILDMEVLITGDKIGKIGQPEQLPDDDLEPDNKPIDNVNGTGASFNNSIMPKPSLATNFMQQDNGNVSLQDQLTHPISSLSPYQNKWVIKARVTNKSGIRKWSNSRGEGQLFSMDLIDESGEIRVTGFRELVDKFYDLFQVDHVYYISKCQIKVANKQFSTLKNDYEMTLTNDSVAQECHDAAPAIPQTKYDFVSIDKIAHIEVDTHIDIIGVCKAASELQVFQAKSTGRELRKREISLVDQSNSGVELTLWGSEAETFDGSTHPILVIKGAKVGEFGGGKTLSVLMSSVMKINPDIPEAHRLRGWFDNGGMEQNITNVSARSGGSGMQTPWMCLKDSQDLSLLKNAEKGEFFQTKGTILLVRSENALYKACPTGDCNKKIIDLQNGMYRCEKCNREFPNFKYRLLAFVNIGDWSGNAFVTMFASEAEKILGMTSQAIGEAIENDPEAMAEIADRVNFKQFMFKCRARTENYNDETRLRTVAVQVDNINYKEYNNHLIARIQELEKELNQS